MRRFVLLLVAGLAAPLHGLVPGALEAQDSRPPVARSQDARPVEIPDLFRQATIGQVTLSPDGTRALYTFTPPSYPEPSRDQQIHLVMLDGSGVRAMTHTKGVQNQGAQWHPSGRFFGFTSTRGGNGRQLFLMEPEGGEPRQVTSVAGGITSWGWSADGSHLAYLAGRGMEAQIRLVDGEGLGVHRTITSHPTPVSSFQWGTAGNHLHFLAPDAWDEGEFRRRREGYAARPIQRGLVFDDFIHLHPQHLWRVDAFGGDPRRITSGDFLVRGFEESPAGGTLAVVMAPRDPHIDDRPNEVYLVEANGGTPIRLTDNDVGESLVGFSPDGAWLAITAQKDFAGSGINEIFVRPVAGGAQAAGAAGSGWTPVTLAYDREVSDVTWAADGERLYFAGNDGVNQNLYVVGARDSRVTRLTDLRGVVSIADGSDPRVAVLGFSDPTRPEDLHVARWDALGVQGAWLQLTNANPWVEEVQLAHTETVRWRSADGTEIEGLVVYPLNHDPSRRYPLITEIHGGPAAVFENRFLPTAGAPHRAYGHLLAARGYAFFLPNYRGSSGYGDDFRTEISGDYWTRATEDIHTGIDHLIEQGLAHPDSLGFMGWSAGGHWSNWMLVTSDRFKAISSGAGVANWISLYAQTDNQSSREFYLGRDPALDAANKPWDDFEHWWNESPLKYIENASTPTLLHYGELDQRIPMPQGQELHLALKSLGVPTEFMVYPGEDHALRQPRNRLVKLMSDLGWFEMWIRGADSWLEWDEVLEMGKRIEEVLATPGQR
jgi:dipeptidyl aminopeptidase/acylaminoacyl peptidase